MKIKTYLLNLFVSLLYPIYKYLSSDNKILAFSDALIIIGLILLIIGVVYWLYQKGDFDLTGYIASRSINKNKQTYDAYRKDQEVKRKQGFNYPIVVSITLIVISIISSLFC